MHVVSATAGQGFRLVDGTQGNGKVSTSDANGNASWQTASSSSAVATVEDIKTGLQSIDHGGWVKLDGRNISSLTSTQQVQANTLFSSGLLPDATGAVLMQVGIGYSGYC